MSALLQGNGNPIEFTDGTLKPLHFSDGLPYEQDGTIAADTVSPIDHYHQGLPFTAQGRLCVTTTGGATEGLELITNGEFNEQGSWSFYSGEEYIANGQMVVAANVSDQRGAASQAIEVVAGKNYIFKVTVDDVVSGTRAVRVNTSSNPNDNTDVSEILAFTSSVGDFEIPYTAKPSQTHVHIMTSNGFGSASRFGSISLKEVGNAYIEGTASTPSSPDIQISGDIDLRFFAAGRWTPPPNYSAAVAKFSASTPFREYELVIHDTGTIGMNLGDGVTVENPASLSSTGYVDGDLGGIRATWTQVSGLADFYLSADNLAWNALGASVATTLTNILAGSNSLEIGSDFGGSSLFQGKVYNAQVWNGIEGSGGFLAANFDPNDWVSGDTWISKVTGEEWTLRAGSVIKRDPVNLPSHYGSGAAPIGEGGRIFIEQAPANHFSSGVPYTPSGAIAALLVVSVERAFSSAFSTGFF